MNELQLSHFADTIVNELDRQTRAVFEIQLLISSQSDLLERGDRERLKRLNEEKKRLLGLITRHNRTLHDFKNNSRNLTNRIAVEAQNKIQAKIETLACAIQDVLGIEKAYCARLDRMNRQGRTE